MKTRPVERPHRMSLRLTREAYDAIQSALKEVRKTGNRYATQTDVVEALAMRCGELLDGNAKHTLGRPNIGGKPVRNGKASLDVPRAESQQADIADLRGMVTAMRKAGLTRETVSAVIAAYVEEAF